MYMCVCVCVRERAHDMTNFDPNAKGYLKVIMGSL
jgi:hypothetical protein